MRTNTNCAFLLALVMSFIPFTAHGDGDVSFAPADSVSTPRGSSVPVWKLVAGDWTTAEARASALYWQSRFPRATVASPATYKYNCHSYAWYQQSPSNPYWMGLTNPADEDAYWTDGSYYLVASGDARSGSLPAGVRTGDKVSYVNSEHSAVVHYFGAFISKWAQGPVMIHLPQDCPYVTDPLVCPWCTNPINFYRR